MRNNIRLLCLLLSFAIVVMCCGCGKKSTKKKTVKISDEYGDTYDDITGSDDSQGTSENDNSSSDNSSGKSNDSNTSGISGIDSSDYKKLMDVPSRANAYKLTNTYNKLKNGDALKVGYYGGSVTSGTGSTKESTNSWRALTTAYLKSLAKGKVTELNSALGGTASYLGAARFDYQIIYNKVDLLFVEFAINDFYNDIPTEQIKRNLEYMISKLNSQNPNADIVFVLITNKSNFGTKYAAYNAHVAVANHYRIPIIDIGSEIYNLTGGSLAKFTEYLSDSVHPNDAGYKVYSEIVIKALKELLVSGATAPHSLPKSKLASGSFTTLENLKPAGFANSEWIEKSWLSDDNIEKKGSQFRYSKLKEQYHTYLTPTASGVTLTVNFTGNSFGFLGTVKNGSSLKFVLDGKTEKTVSGSSKDELLEYPVFENISNSAHTVTITASGSSPAIAIASFVVTK